MALTDDMIAMLCAGVAHQVGGCTNAGRPVVCRGMAAQHEAGRLLVIISSESGFEVLDAIRQNGNIAVNVTLPSNYRSMSFVGNDAIVRGSGAAWRPLVTERHAAFRELIRGLAACEPAAHDRHAAVHASSARPSFTCSL